MTHKHYSSMNLQSIKQPRIMKLHRILVYTLFLLVSAASLTQAQKRYDELSFPELGEIDKPKIHEFTTDNGIRFFLVENEELPLIDVSVRIRTGGVLVPNEKAGLSSVTGTVIRSGGTESIPSDSLNVLLENRAASMETGISFSSGSAGMNVLKEDFDKMLPVFVDLLKNPAFPEEKIEQAKKQEKTQISRRNDEPQQVAIREFQRLIYGKDSNYGRLQQYETINSISREDLQQFHSRHFNGENMMVGVVGDFKWRKMRRKLKDAFESIESGSNTNLNFPEIDYEYESSVNLIDKPDVNQSVVLMGHLGGLRSNPDYAKLQVMNEVLSGGFSGRLFQKVRTDMGLAYAVFGQYQSNTFYPGVFYTGVMTKSSTTAEAIDAIKEEIVRLQEEPITEQELKEVKDQFLNSLVFRYDSKQKVLNQHMSYIYRDMDPDEFEQYIEEVKAVTIEDVQKVAQEYMKPDSMHILVVGNKSEIGDQLNKYGTVNEIDISIPEPGSSTADTEQGDTKKGNALLGKMADAIITEGELTSITADYTQSMGPQEMEVSQEIDFSREYLKQDISTPQGNMTVLLEDGEAKRMMGGQEQALPGSAAKQIKAEMNKNYLAIARNHENLTAEFMGMETVEGTELAKVKVNLDKPVTLFINPDTHLPEIMKYQQFNPQAGQQMKMEQHYSNWKTANGVNYAYTVVIYANGSERGRIDVHTHSAD